MSSANSQNLVYEVEFETFFDNREYLAMQCEESRTATEFAISFAPIIGVEFNENNRLNFGVQCLAPFDESEGNELFESVELILFYGFDSANWSSAIGIFPRSRMAIESYSTAFFAEDYLLNNRLISGLMGQYRVDDSFIELVCDWECLSEGDSREKFRIFSAARKYYSIDRRDLLQLYAGYNLSVTHFAGVGEAEFVNVVDNELVNPRLGVRLNGSLGVDLSMSYLLSLQRDRSFVDEWLFPQMGEVALELKYRGFTLWESYYFGDDIEPLYDGFTLGNGTLIEYGSQLYTGDPFFRTSSGFYNRAALGYSHSFFEDKLELGVEFITHADGTGLGTEQMFNVTVNLGGGLGSIKRE